MERGGPTIRVVLVNPLDPKNVGSACRAMKTMGIRELCLVGNPELDQLDLGAAAVTAVHAQDVLERAEIVPGLPEAVRGAVLVAGITRRLGKRRKYMSLTPEQLADRVASLREGSVALVFGNEASGLSDRELASCHVAVHIPSSPEFPSLNLSHAVQVIAYLVHRRLVETQGRRSFRPISRERLELLVEEILSVLHRIGFFSQGSREEMGVFLRDILARSALARREADRLAVVFRKIAGLFLRARRSHGNS
ncbi:MAG: TrmJ/YjtD family RNA methyltransferase [Spirochaetales bacterium]|nr:TrmJ/YjtD family RNA methyltransferase [Spirochaetales bacterium]